jgi:hypothetical protein
MMNELIEALMNGGAILFVTVFAAVRQWTCRDKTPIVSL